MPNKKTALGGNCQIQNAEMRYNLVTVMFNGTNDITLAYQWYLWHLEVLYSNSGKRATQPHQNMIPVQNVPWQFHCNRQTTGTIIVKLRRVELFMKLHLRATGCHLPYWITQFYLTQVNTLNPARGRYSIYVPRRAGRLRGDRLHTKMVYSPADGHSSKN